MKTWKYISISVMCMVSTVSLFSQVTLTGKNIKCPEDGGGKVAVASISNATFPIKNYQWSNGHSGSHMKEITGLAAGTYTVTVTDAHGCTASASYQVMQPPSALQLDLTSSADEFYLCGIASIIVVAQPSGGTPPYTTNGQSGAYGVKVSLATFGGGPKYLDFETSDANGCKAKRRQFFAFSAVGCASDPNDIAGPIGIEDPRWISSKDRMEYVIRYENDPVLATAAAQVVKVTLPVSPKMNAFSLQLGDFGWGPYTFNVPEGSTYYQTRLDLRDSLNLYVDVTAGYNINTNEFFWLLTSIDPNTGQLPLDPQQGFLPVDDTLTGSGEGFIHFSVVPKATAVTGDSISAKAKIIFDINEPILTNAWQNKLDAVAPTSELGALIDSSENNVIDLQWTGEDDPGGVGVGDYSIFVAIDGGAPILLADKIQSEEYLYTSEPGHTYGFSVLATDRVGNREAMKPQAEATIYVIPVRQIELIHPAGHDLCLYDTTIIAWTKITTDSIKLEMSIDSGFTYFTLANALTADSFALFLADSLVSDHVFFRLTDLDMPAIVLVSQPISIHVLPVVDAGPNQNLCFGSYTFLDATGANQFQWDADSTLNLFDVYNPRATTSTFKKYYVTGTDVYGCVDRDSVTVFILPTFLDSVVIALCNEDSIFLAGAYQTEPGYYTDLLASYTGCDSTVVTQLVLTGPCPFPSPYVYVDKDAVGLNNGSSWANAFNDLQDALDAVDYYNNIREIWIAEGEYHPASTADRNASYLLRDSVTIYGGFLGTETARSERVLDPSLVRLSGDLGVANDSTDNAYHVVKVDSLCGDCILDGLTISFGHANGIPVNASIGAGLWVKGKILLNNLVIERNTTTMDGAAIYNSGANAILTIQNCLFRLNTSGLERDILNSAGAQLEFQGLNTIQN